MRKNNSSNSSKKKLPEDLSTEEKLDLLFELITHAENCAALTGAGVSTLSGIRDFRGKNGLYNDMDAQKIFDIDYFNRDPSFYYSHARDFIYNLKEKEASVVHLTLGKLEDAVYLKGVITQNIDLLHQKGGSSHVIEIHGSPSVHYCRRCSNLSHVEDLAASKPSGDLGSPDLMSFEQAAEIAARGELPKCGKCGAVLKPAITFFGESLPARALHDAEALARRADPLLVLGTSLTVYPAAAIPEITLRSGGRIVIVNNMPTPLDRAAVLTFDDLETVFSGIGKRLAGKISA
ncbi:MAG: NAD-dependent deacetylase [Spirochaetaceae bacterium]|jgi:NAD-dependent deacetylase|nr:NAD-dependent deacetylase [Spirochaetaceae bacterium]